MEKRPRDVDLSPILLLTGSDISTRLIHESKLQSFLVQNESDRIDVGLMKNLNKIRHVKHPE